MADSTYRVGGLVSGMDTNSIIDKLVELEKRPITLYQSRQKAINTHLSDLASLTSKLDAFSSATKSLGSDGVSVIKPSATSYDDFSISGKPTYAGRYKVNVDSLATSAKMRFTTGFDSADSVVNSSGATNTLKFRVDDTTDYSINVDNGMTLAQVAARINAGKTNQVSPVTASIVSDGSKYYLTITRKDTGYGSAAAADGLKLKDEGAGELDGGLGAYSKTDASNAKVFVDDLVVTSRTNDIKNVIPGATLSLKKASQTDTNLVFDRQTTDTAANVQKFVDAFNSVAKFLSDNLRPEATAAADSRLSGSALVSLQLSLQKIVSTRTVSEGPVQALADIGVKIGKDGQLSLDKDKLEKALGKDPDAINTLFSRSTTGVSAVTAKLISAQTNGIDGALTVRKKAYQAEIKRLDNNIAKSQVHVDAFKAQLVKSFTAMEQLLGGFQSVSNYLGQQQTAANKNS